MRKGAVAVVSVSSASDRPRSRRPCKTSERRATRVPRSPCAGTRVQSWPWPPRCSRWAPAARKCRSVCSNPVPPCTRFSSIDGPRRDDRRLFTRSATHTPLDGFLFCRDRLSGSLDVKWIVIVRYFYGRFDHPEDDLLHVISVTEIERFV